jgi:hypothetical protein
MCRACPNHATHADRPPGLPRQRQPATHGHPALCLAGAGHQPGARWQGHGLARFAAGDLVGIVAPGSAVPRYYSLASGWEDGFLEICVRLLPGGLCSAHLLGLKPGEPVAAFIRPNPGFALPRTQAARVADRGGHRCGTAGGLHPPQRQAHPHAPVLWRARPGAGLFLWPRHSALAG